MRMTIANLLTVSRLFIAPMFLAFILTETAFGMSAAAILFFIGALTDWFDGYLARKYGEESELGKFLDPLADKVLTSTAFVSFYIVDVMPLWMLVVIVLRDFGTTAMRSFAEEKGKPIVTSRNAKVKTFIQMVFISYALFLMWLSKTWTDVAIMKSANNLLYSSSTYYILLGITLFTLWTAVEYVFTNPYLFKRLVK